MKRLLLNTVQKEGEDGVVTSHVFQIQGDEAEYSSKAVAFRPYDHQIKLIARDANDPLRVTCETVFAEGVQKGIPLSDTQGGNACGRTFPSWEGRELTKDEQQENRRRAGYYGFLFGEVTFPGKAPIVVNLRLTSKLNQTFSTFQNKELGRLRSGWPSVLMEMKAKGQSGNPQFSEIIFTKLEKSEYKPHVEVLEDIELFIEEHNSKIKEAAQNV